MRNFSIRAEGITGFIHFVERTTIETQWFVHHKLAEVAEPVREEATRLFTKFSAKSAAGYAIRTDTPGIVDVYQTIPKTTGRHPEWGALQMREALLPALDRKSSEVEDRLGTAIGDIIEGSPIGGEHSESSV